MTGRRLFEMSCDEIIWYFKAFLPEDEYFWYATTHVADPFRLYGIRAVYPRLPVPPRRIEKKIPAFCMQKFKDADSLIDYRVEISNSRLGHIRIEWIGKEVTVSKIKC